MEILSNLVRIGATLAEVAFNIREDIPSGPFDFVRSREFNSPLTSSTVHSAFDQLAN